MTSRHDERKGLVKVYWADIRKRVVAVEPKFAHLVDELNPDKSFPLYLAYYPYGNLKGDTESTFIPKLEGGSYRLSDPDAPKDIIKHLGYGIGSSPFGMVLEKEFEYFIDLKDERISMPQLIYTPGKFFPLSGLLSLKSKRSYAANAILSVASGARSAFILPNIGCVTNHARLQREFNIRRSPPKSMYEHWYLFKEIIHSGLLDNRWVSCILYFSEKWVEKLLNDKQWLILKMYLFELAWGYFAYERNRHYYDFIFSVIQKKRNLKPNPYLTDTARHLFTIALGEAPGYAPACKENALPLDALQKVFAESYDLKKYLPTIMQPEVFSFEHDRSSVYYSLQNPSTHMFSPKSRNASSTLFELRELEHIMRVFKEELASTQSLCSDTILFKISKGVEFQFFHNEIDRHRVIRPSTEVLMLDKKFNKACRYSSKDARFASDSKFMRGCISITKNDDT